MNLSLFIDPSNWPSPERRAAIFDLVERLPKPAVPFAYALAGVDPMVSDSDRATALRYLWTRGESLPGFIDVEAPAIKAAIAAHTFDASPETRGLVPPELQVIREHHAAVAHAQGLHFIAMLVCGAPLGAEPPS